MVVAIGCDDYPGASTFVDDAVRADARIALARGEWSRDEEEFEASEHNKGARGVEGRTGRRRNEPLVGRNKVDDDAGVKKRASMMLLFF